jgi:uroporphyrinogen-III synthase
MFPLLMTRPRLAAERFVAGLSPAVRRRVRPIYAPLMQIVAGADRVDLTGVSGVIFTSANGVSAASDLTPDRTLPAYCVGVATAGTARDLNWPIAWFADDANDLVVRLTREEVTGPLVHFCGRHTRGKVAERLTEAGCPTRRQVVYDQELLTFKDEVQKFLSQQTSVIVPIFSPRTARQFVCQCPKCPDLHLAALSDAAAEPLKGMAYSSLTVADRPNAEGMVAVIEKLVARLSRVERCSGEQ